MRYKDFKLKLKSADDNSGEFEGFAAVFGNVDLQDEKIERGAFSKTLQERPDLPVLWQHDTAEPIGVTVRAEETDHGLQVKGRLNLETQRGREAYALLKQGAVKGLSIGYDVVKDSVQNGVRKLLEVKLWEWSLVTLPANPKALVTAVKTAVPSHTPPIVDEAWDAEAAEARIRSWATSDDEIDWEKHSQGFAWYDAENREVLGAYKLPHHDIRDGELVTIKRGVTAAAAAIQGAHGGVDIPESDVDAVKRHLARHYEQFDATPPWETEETESSDDTQPDDKSQSEVEAKMDELIADIRETINRYFGGD